jgi:tRNA nucleotidyltransferase (CCA-adding enzyme)
MFPEKVKFILTQLNKNGYDAYVCGGAVRDILLKKIPKDYDITTNALPEQVKSIFSKTIDTGLKHGTVTVILEKDTFEITTFRTDGNYSDNRHPDKVNFTALLKEDSSRRDFTINAMAMDINKQIYDYFDGQKDLKNKKIKCVGNPSDRFNEDALRMLRAVRFASQLGFNINEDIKHAILNSIKLLKNISKERIREEFNKILMSNYPIYGLNILIEWNFMKYICPEIYKTYEFQQYNLYHVHTVCDHILESINIIKPDLSLRLTMFFHDIGKPECFSKDENGHGHFYNHSRISVDIAERTMKNLKYNNDIIKKVVNLVKYHEYDLEPKKSAIKRFLNKTGEENFSNWYEVRTADILTQNLKYALKRLEKLFEIKVLYKEIQKDKDCFTLKNLAINGNDLIDIGIKPGKEIGTKLQYLLEKVIENPELNTKEQLLKNFLKVNEEKERTKIC